MSAFWFGPVDPRAAAWLRILLGLATPLFFRWWDLELIRWGHIGWVVRLYEEVFFTAGYAAVPHALCLVFALGWRPRRVGPLAVLLLAPYCFARPGYLSGQIVLFALAAFSFVRSDAALTPFRRPAAAPSPMWPIRLMQLQLSLLYGINAVAKASPEYLRGDALVAMSLLMWNFRADFTSGFLHLGSLAIPVLPLAVASVLTEAFLAVAFWFPRLRWPAAVVGVGFHTTLRFVVQIYLLGWATLLLYPSFLLPLAQRPAGSAADGRG